LTGERFIQGLLTGVAKNTGASDRGGLTVHPNVHRSLQRLLTRSMVLRRPIQ